MKKYRIKVQGMTCNGCEEHVATALEHIGAANIEASFRREEATFELPDEVEIDTAKKPSTRQNINPVMRKFSNLIMFPILAMRGTMIF